MSKRTHIREFLSFQSKRKGTESINESVVEKDKSFLVNGIEIEKRVINSYVTDVKKKTGKDLKSMYSEMQLAEELLKWSVQNLSDMETIPVSALLGGEEEMAQDLDDEGDTDVDETGDLDIEETDEPEEDNTDLDDEPAEGEDTEGDEDFDVNFDDDEFESPEGEDSDDEIDVEEFEGEEGETGDADEGEEGEEGEDTDEDEDEDEDTDLPV